MTTLKEKARQAFTKWWSEYILFHNPSANVTRDGFHAGYEAGALSMLAPLTEDEQSRLGMAVCHSQMGNLCACANEGTLPSREHAGCRSRMDAAVAAFTRLVQLRTQGEKK